MWSKTMSIAAARSCLVGRQDCGESPFTCPQLGARQRTPLSKGWSGDAEDVVKAVMVPGARLALRGRGSCPVACYPARYLESLRPD
jgi:hypothetical protein